MWVHLDNHKEVIPECKGCQRVFVVNRGGKKIEICSCSPCPDMEWLLGECSRHTDREKRNDPA